MNRPTSPAALMATPGQVTVTLTAALGALRLLHATIGTYLRNQP